jgi:hypothetical protein
MFPIGDEVDVRLGNGEIAGKKAVWGGGRFEGQRLVDCLEALFQVLNHSGSRVVEGGLVFTAGRGGSGRKRVNP